LRTNTVKETEMDYETAVLYAQTLAGKNEEEYFVVRDYTKAGECYDVTDDFGMDTFYFGYHIYFVADEW
jgi:hypothetical protein